MARLVLTTILFVQLFIAGVKGQAAGAACGANDACDDNLVCDSDGNCKNALTASCTPGQTANCPVNAECTGDSGSETCTCSDPYAEDGGLCTPAAGKIGGSCTSGDDSTCPTNAGCTGAGDTCACKSGYQTKTSDLTCEPEDGKIGGTCTSGDDSTCTDNASCTGSTCVCKTRYKTKADLTCEPVLIGDNCPTGDTDCPTNADCDGSTSNPCECNTGYSSSEDKTTCIADGQLNGKCKTNDVCDTNNTICENAKCVCGSGFKANTAGNACESGAVSVISSIALLLAALLTAFRLL